MKKLFPQPWRNFFHLFESVVAAVYFGFPGKKMVIVGVTGTDGKTTTVNLIHHILTTAKIKTGMWSTISSAHTTTPGRWRLQKFLAECVRNGDTHAVVEVSSHAIDQNRLWGIDFTVGVLTNIADNEHLDYHKTFTSYAKTKLRFLQTCKKVVLPEAVPQLSISNFKPRLDRSQFSISQWDKYHYQTKLPGDFNRLNILAAAAACRELGLDEETIRKAVAGFEPLPGRLEILAKKPFTVIVDFAHTPQAFENVLPVAKKMGKRLIHVFGCTGDRDKGKRPLMGAIAAKYDDVIILTHEDTYSENPGKIMDEIEKGISLGNKGNRGDGGYYKIGDRGEAIHKALMLAKPGDVVLLTGVGHQKTMNIGGREIPWSDQKAVLNFLDEKAG